MIEKSDMKSRGLQRKKHIIKQLRFKLLLFYLVFMLILSNFIIIMPVCAVNNVNVTLIDELDDYTSFGYQVSKVQNPYVYKNQVLCKAHMPLALQIETQNDVVINKNIAKNIMNYQQQNMKNFNIDKIEYYILINESYSYEQTMITETTSQHLNRTTYTDYDTTYKTINDYRYIWIPIKDYTGTIQDNDILIIDIVGKFKANPDYQHVDIIPEINLPGFSKSYPEYAWWNSSWLNAKKITFNTSQINTTLTNFPVLINITDSDVLSKSQHDGDDIAFTNFNNSTQLNHELEWYDHTGYGLAWVNITTLNSSSPATEIWIYYNNSAASNQQNPTGVWDSNYMAVWHGVNLSDSTSNGWSLEKNNAVSENTSGQVAGCFEFDQSGTLQYLYNTTLLDVMPTSDELTLECWVFQQNSDSGSYIYKENVASQDRINLRDSDTNAQKISLFGEADTGNKIVYSNNARSTTNWFYACGVYDAGNALKVFLNNDSNTGDVLPSIDDGSSQDFMIGSYDGAGTYKLTGKIDEIRVSNIARSDNWVACTYNTYFNDTDGGFYTFGSENTFVITAPSVQTNASTNVSLDGASLNGYLTDDGGDSNCTVWLQYGLTTSYGSNTSNTSNVVDPYSFYFNVSGLLQGTTYHFRAVTNNSNTTSYGADRSFTTLNTPDPPYNADDTYNSGSNVMNLSWTRGNYSDNDVVVSSSSGYPTSVSDGTVVQNSSSLTYYTFTPSTTMYYSVFSYNSTYNVFSSALNLPWGVIGLNVFNESNPSQALTFNIEISNEQGTDVYYNTSQSNTFYLSSNDIPYGTNTIFVVSSSNYETRIYYNDLVINNFYNFSFYLPPEVENTSLYQFTVVGPQGEYGNDPPVENAKIQVQRYNNVTDVYTDVGSYLSDANGQFEVYLINNGDVLYRFIITKTGYETEYSSYIPTTVVLTHTFRLVPEGSDDPDIPSYDDFWTDITFNATLHNNNTIYVNFNDANSSVTNTHIRIYDFYNGTDTYITNDARSGDTSFYFWASVTNNTHDHKLKLWFNTTANYDVSIPVTIIVYGVNKTLNTSKVKFNLESRFSSLFGPFELGYTNTICIVLALIVLGLFGPFNAGVGIISCGLSILLMQGVLAVWTVNSNIFLGGISLLIILLGVFYTITIRTEEKI